MKQLAPPHQLCRSASLKRVKISFPAHWGVGRMPVPPNTDLLATISMFEQIKAEPIGFYSACPPPPPPGMVGGQRNPADSQQQQQQQQQTSVITSNEDNKELQQSMSGVSTF